MHNLMLWLHKQTSKWYAKNVLMPAINEEISKLDELIQRTEEMERELDDVEYEVVFEPDFDRTVH